MKNVARKLLAGLGAAVLVTSLAPKALAGCGDGLLKQKSSWSESVDGQLAKLDLVNYGAYTSIVGLWSENYTVGGKQFDFGYSVWHSDGTEFLNSGGRSPSTQNYCLGVWKQTGPSTYKLNHFALGYDTNGKFVANTNIRQEVTLDDDADSFAGTFTIDVYDPNWTKLLQHVAGKVTGRRITVD